MRILIGMEQLWVGPGDEDIAAASLKTCDPNNWQFLEWLSKCLSSGYKYIERQEQKSILIPVCSQENFCPIWTEMPILKFNIHSAVQNCQSLESEGFNDVLNRSVITGPHPKPLHSNWNSHLYISPCCASYVEFFSLLGSASSRVPTPLNSDVTSSLPVAWVTPITNILHFSLAFVGSVECCAWTILSVDNDRLRIWSSGICPF